MDWLPIGKSFSYAVPQRDAHFLRVTVDLSVMYHRTLDKIHLHTVHLQLYMTCASFKEQEIPYSIMEPEIHDSH